MEVDLNTHFIPATQRVWRMFPGQGYVFLEDFAEQNVVFLDMPFLMLPQSEISTANDMTSRIAMSQEASRLINENGPEATINLSLSDFANSRNSQARGRARQALINLFEEAQTNDLIVVPEPMYLSYVRIGRLSSDIRVECKSPKKFGENVFYGRQVTWLSRVRENTLSAPLSDSLRNQHAFTLLENSLYLEAFSVAYSSFVYADRHVSTIFNEDEFLDTDSAFLGIISRLAAAACRSIDEGRDGIDRSELLEILINSPPIEYTCNQESDIHSKGFTRFISGTIVALVISSLTASYMGLAEAESAETFRRRVDELVIINSGSNADPECAAWVSEATRRVVNSFDTEQSMIMCQNIRRANRRGALKPSARPKPAQD